MRVHARRHATSSRGGDLRPRRCTREQRREIAGGMPRDGTEIVIERRTTNPHSGSHSRRAEPAARLVRESLVLFMLTWEMLS
jgi:hypothetical protein